MQLRKLSLLVIQMHQVLKFDYYGLPSLATVDVSSSQVKGRFKVKDIPDDSEYTVSNIGSIGVASNTSNGPLIAASLSSETVKVECTAFFS